MAGRLRTMANTRSIRARQEREDIRISADIARREIAAAHRGMSLPDLKEIAYDTRNPVLRALIFAAAGR